MRKLRRYPTLSPDRIGSHKLGWHVIVRRDDS